MHERRVLHGNLHSPSVPRACGSAAASVISSPQRETKNTAGISSTSKHRAHAKASGLAGKGGARGNGIFASVSGLDTNDSELLIDRKGSTQTKRQCITILQDVFGYRHSKKAALQLWSHRSNMQINNKHRTSPTGKLAELCILTALRCTSLCNCCCCMIMQGHAPRPEAVAAS